MFELLFLLSFTLHNIEEALWLPDWSKYAKKFHPVVEKNEFHFAVLVITVIGYILTFLFLIFGGSSEIIKYLYFGFLLGMCLNAIFPHFIAMLILKRYSPGTITGILLNIPIGIYIIFLKYNESLNNYKLWLGFIIFSIVALAILKPLFKIGKRIL